MRIGLGAFVLFYWMGLGAGDNRDLVPMEAPSNLTLLDIGGRQVLIEWDPVNTALVRGFFRGYLVRTWNHAGSQVYAFPPEITKASVEFFPHSKNFITVSARNEKYVGPPSEAISFDAPQIEPNLPYILNVYSLSDKSVLLRWSKPTEPNGILLGYKIYAMEINDTIDTWQVSYQINDPDKLQAKLTDLQPGVEYRMGVSAINCAGEGDIKTAEIALATHSPAAPSPPHFIYKINYTFPNREELCRQPVQNQEEEEAEDHPPEYDYYDGLLHNETKKVIPAATSTRRPVLSEEEYMKRCLVDCMILWLPDVKNNPGEHFYVKYKVKGENEYQTTEPEVSDDYMILANFDACRNYEIVLTAVDGEHSTDSGILVTPTKIV